VKLEWDDLKARLRQCLGHTEDCYLFSYAWGRLANTAGDKVRGQEWYKIQRSKEGRCSKFDRLEQNEVVPSVSDLFSLYLYVRASKLVLDPRTLDQALHRTGVPFSAQLMKVHQTGAKPVPPFCMWDPGPRPRGDTLVCEYWFLQRSGGRAGGKVLQHDAAQPGMSA